jgi:phytoene dehydrogenase-like protein
MERPFAKAPGLATSTGAYLLGPMPPELLAETGVDIPLKRRDPHYFLPTLADRYLLLGSDQDAARRRFTDFFSDADWRANERMEAEIAALRDDVAPAWLEEPLSIEDTAERYVRPALRRVFVDLCRGPVGAWLDRFGFASDLVKAMYAVTDGFSGLCGTWSTPGTGMNFLVHNMCRLPGSDGTWMIPVGGMGAISGAFAKAAREAGAVVETGRGVARVEVSGGVATGVVLTDGTRVAAPVVAVNADPFAMLKLVDGLPADYVRRIEGYRRPGTTMKVNLALRGLPAFACLPRDEGQHRTTTHILPQADPIGALEAAYREVEAGRLPDFPTIEWYIHTAVDPSLRDAEGHHGAALFVQWVPHTLAGTTWEAEETRYVEHLLAICDRFAPGTRDLTVDWFALHPRKIEEHFGITGGHIHHVDNGFGFADRLPYRTPVDGLYACGAGTHPAGAVIGCAGRNAARRILNDLGR